MIRCIENIDEHGNCWKVSLETRKGSTNRFELSFFLNSKKFVLSRITTKIQAEDTWEHLSKIIKEGTPLKIDEELPMKKRGRKNEQ